ncbi:hypothetical protein BDR07DRAFT_1440338 [Suillus spraguei]|nr:hypothetical protein BDR07DRAFT_1440338 [Suillus spraguei]
MQIFFQLFYNFIVVTYDWVLTFGQEVELVWRQRWSLMTVLYLAVRYLGIFYVVCIIIYATYDWTVPVIIITRLHAMYQRSRKILIFLVVTSLAVNIFSSVVTIMAMMYISGEELILSGTYQCSYNYVGDILLLTSLTWIIGTVWEVLALCLAIWIAVKHFRELRQHSAGGIIGDCLHFVAVSCFQLIHDFSPVEVCSSFIYICIRPRFIDASFL